MRVALVHELLTMRGGAERVLKVLATMFPEAPIYTLLYDEAKLGDWFPKERVRTSMLQPRAKLFSQFAIRNSQFAFNHHLYLPWFPTAVEKWDFSEFDLVISSSSAFAHGIITNGAPKHLCYVHSPARYLWDRTHDVLEQASKGLLGDLRKTTLSCVFNRLRMWDSEAADRPDVLLAASKEVQQRIALYWRRESEVITPPVDDFWFQERRPIREQMEHGEYFLIVSTLAHYKRIDLAIRACNELGAWLKIVGEGPDMRRLKNIAGPTIEFYGFRQLDELADLFASARATIFPGEEDFGLVPLESMACGTPVIAYRSGGALETIAEGETGMFFDEPTAASLQNSLENFDRSQFERERCREKARVFSRERFEASIQGAIASVI